MKGLLSKIEYLIIGIFAVIFLMWAVSKCSSYKEKAMKQARIEAGADSTATAKQANAPAQSSKPETSASQPATTPQPTTTPPPAGQQAAKPKAAQPSPAQESQGTRLYVTIDKLKIRKTPGLKGEVLGELKLFDEVYFQGEATDSTYEVNLGKEMANEPYVKIKTRRGTVGWVYGAGVHYIRKKRSGVLE